MPQMSIIRQPIQHVSEIQLQQYIHNRLIACWEDSIKEFVKVALENILIDTGMSRASLMPLGAQVRLKSYINKNILSGKISPAQKHPRKSRALGEALGRQAYNINFGTPSVPNLSFEFHIVVFQHYLHEDKGHYKYSKNMQSMSKGEKEFLKFFNANWESYIKVATIIDMLKNLRPKGYYGV